MSGKIDGRTLFIRVFPYNCVVKTGLREANVITHINDKLNAWAMWSVRNSDGGIGWGNSQLAMLAATYGGAFAGVPLDVDDEMTELDQIVCALPETLNRAVRVCYLGRGTVEQKVRDCQCARRTYFDRLSAAHKLVMEALQVGIGDVPQLASRRAKVRSGLHAMVPVRKKVLTGLARTV